MTRRALILILSVLVLASLAGCSSGNKPVQVEVSASDFNFTSSLTTFKVGVPYEFVVTNNGTVAHEMMIMKPMMPGEGSMEELDQMALAMIEEEDLQPGQTATLEYTFTQEYPQGELEFACHVEGHYESGMHLAIEVTK